MTEYGARSKKLGAVTLCTYQMPTARKRRKKGEADAPAEADQHASAAALA